MSNRRFPPLETLRPPEPHVEKARPRDAQPGEDPDLTRARMTTEAMAAVLDENERLKASNNALMSAVERVNAEVRNLKAKLDMVTNQHNALVDKQKASTRTNYSALTAGQIAAEIRKAKTRLDRLEKERASR